MLESESLKLKEEVKRLTSLLDTARKSKSDIEGRLEELRGIISKVRRRVHLSLELQLCYNIL